MQCYRVGHVLSDNALRLCLWFLLVVFFVITTHIALSDSHTPRHNSPAGHRPTHGAVASENKICSRIGTDLLAKAGGNAADAMVATVLCVGVIGMYHGGIGGGGFMLVRSEEGEYESIDFREAAPMDSGEDMFRYNVKGSMFGGLARWALSLFVRDG